MRLVLAHGCFDCLHYGHLAHLKAARRLGDYLIVSVTADRFVAKPGRPIFDEYRRAQMLRALRAVDQVVINFAPDASEMIRELKPAVFVKGADYAASGIIAPERAACEEVGAKIHYTHTEKYSTTALLAKIMESAA